MGLTMIATTALTLVVGLMPVWASYVRKLMTNAVVYVRPSNMPARAMPQRSVHSRESGQRKHSEWSPMHTVGQDSGQAQLGNVFTQLGSLGALLGKPCLEPDHARGQLSERRLTNRHNR